ncbi:Uncharacterized membrane protein [Noviherbaspirillum humi]|uniref:Uncharacterized membrane protein n=1 Tax=Noviherbaspirillum humi TaxID=1688639 RepID=A0A239M9S0_9BURK|nr:PACE efflux transporter [Noviherbaspirillum humi]SNT39485.1 Uncharacterized membrane protein [Noviherbaspirillum humi]
MQGTKRRVVYVFAYEAIAIAICSVSFSALTGKSLFHASALSMAASGIAVAWNFIFNMAFERWESRQTVKGRSFKRRAAHAVGFEIGLIFLLVPLIAWWLEVSLWQALIMDLGLALFFLCYTFVFNWVFDHLFGLPASATGNPTPG